MQITSLTKGLCFSLLASALFATPTLAGELVLVERATSDAVTDLGAAGDSSGDILTFHNELFDEANAAKQGELEGFCIRSTVGLSWSCSATIALADGQLLLEGIFHDSGDSLFAVVGGTGAHQGAKGEILLQARPEEPGTYRFDISLL